MCQATIICLPLFRQEIPWAFVFALLKAGRSIAAKMAMMAMTTNNSIRVNAGNCRLAANGKERGDFWLFIGSMLNVYRMPAISVKSTKKEERMHPDTSIRSSCLVNHGLQQSEALSR